MAELLTRNGVIVLVSAISPYRAVRDEMRARIGKFLEIYVEAPWDVCRRRDINGVYRRAASGEIHNVTRLDDPYEPPLSPDVVRHTGHETPEESVAKVLDRVESWIAHTRQLQ